MFTFIKFFGLFCIASLFVAILEEELKAVIKSGFKVVFIVVETLASFLYDLKQRITLSPPYNIPLIKCLAGTIGYGILLSGMVAAIIANLSLLRTRLEAAVSFPFEESLLTRPIILGVLITFVETVFFYFTLESWVNPSFLKKDAYQIPDRPRSFCRIIPALFVLLLLLVLTIDVYVTFKGSEILMNSTSHALTMSVFTVALSLSFGIISFFCLKPFYVMIISLLRNIVSALIDFLSLIIILIHNFVNNLLFFLLSIIELGAKLGGSMVKPFKKFENNYRSKKLPTPTKIITVILIGLISLAGSSQRLIISQKCIIVLLDLTGSFDYLDESVQHIDNVIKNLMPGDEIYVLSITGTSFYDKNILFKGDVPLPKYTNELYSEKYRSTVEFVRVEFSNRWKKVAKGLRNNAKETDIIGGIAYAAMIFTNTGSRHNYLAIYSDLERNVSENCCVKLDEIKVWCLYVEHKHVKKYKEKENSWRQYFKKAGIREEDIIIRIPAQSSEITIK